MQSKAPARNAMFRLEDREQQLTSFVAEALEQVPEGRPDTILLVTRSLESLATRVIADLSPKLAQRGIGAHLVLAAPARAAMPAERSFAGGFHHEVRIVADPRLLGAHEQIVLGESALWFGDSMRRDPDKLDAFATFSRDAGAARAARTVFARLWVLAAPGSPGATDAAAAELPLLPSREAAAGEMLTAGVLETLRAWHPFTRH